MFCKLNRHLSYLRTYSTKEANKNVIKYTDTINLPKTKFPARINGTKRLEVEKKINEVSTQFF